MTEYNDLRTGKPIPKIACYKCDSQKGLLVEEKRRDDTGEIIEKIFICIFCANMVEG